MIDILLAAMVAVSPCKDINAVKRIWDTNEYYVQYKQGGPWFWIDGKEFRDMKCEIRNYTVIG